MKQEATKKNKKLVWLIVGLVALLLVVGAVLAILLLPGSNQQTNEPTGPVGGRPDLYWNVDRQKYLGDAESAGLSTREPGEDGLYHIRFAYNGELVEYAFADKRLVNVIDNQDVIGLNFDADGNPVDAIDPTTIATEVAKSFFVVSNKNGQLTLNSSIAMNGMQLPVPTGELTQIYDVRQDAPNPGAIAEVEPMDKVVVYANDKGETTHVYIVERQPEAAIYWRVDKMYDSTTKETSRVPDENGVYTITFAKDGKHVDLYSTDKALVTEIDKTGVAYNAPKGLIVDDKGFITGTVDPVVAIRGKLAGSEYHITEMNGSQITATYLLSGKEQGKSFTVDVPEDCPIYNVCVGGSADMIGEPTELQMYDRIICYTDLEGKPVLIFVMYRMANVPMYWNIERQYNSTTGETARTPDANGYYVFKMAVGGKQVTLKTKDKAIASTIDSFSYFMCGLEVEGNIIKRVYRPVYVSGNDYYGAGGIRLVSGQTGSILSFVTSSSSSWSPVNLVLKPDVEVYDVTGYPGTKVGEKTTYKEGDTIRIVADYNDNITHIYVVARYTGKPIFFNFARKYNTTKNETTRVPQGESGQFPGYYVYQMASKGKTYTVITKDKKVADIIDAQNAPIVALDTKKTTEFKDAQGNVIENVLIAKMAYEAVTSLPYGVKQANYRRFLSLENGTMTTMIESTGATDQWKVADDVKIYNCSTVYTKNRGEVVKSLQYWDQIQGVATKDDGTIKEIYIMKRQAPSKFYYNGSRKYDSTNLVTTRKKEVEGPYTGYYVYSLTCEGKEATYITNRDDIANTIDSFNYVPFGLTVKKQSDGVYLVTQAFEATSIKGVKATGSSNYDVTKISKTEMTVECFIPTNANYGKTLTLKLSPNLKTYNVSAYAEEYGSRMKLGLGDRFICYTNMDGEVEWAYVWYENTHQKGHISKCPHCNKNVYWMPYIGGSTASYSNAGADNVHLYVTDSVKKRAQTNHGLAGMDAKAKENTHVILDLNGQTLLASSGRNFLVYGEMTIVDTVGGGKMQGSTDAGTASGGAIMVRENGVLNLLSGTLTENPKNVTNANGGVLYLSENSTFNMKGGVIEGGTATSAGGNIYASGSATLNLSGGTIAGDVAVVSKDVTVNISGNAKITSGKSGGLILNAGVLLPLSGVTAENKIVVDPQGVFTEESDNIESYLSNFSSSYEEYPIVVEGKALAGGVKEFCEHCQQEVYWTAWAGQTASGHYMLFEDMERNTQITVGSCATSSGNPPHGKEGAKCNHAPDVVINLNGHTITCNKVEGMGGSSTGRFALVYAGLSIVDTSEGQTGKITTTNNNPGLNAGLILASTGSKVNLYGGELTANEGCTAGVGGIVNMGAGTFKMYGGKITNGTAVATQRTDGAIKGGTGGNLYLGSYATAYIYGGEISGGKAVACVTTNVGADGKTTTTSKLGQGGNIYNLGKLYIGTADGTLAAVVKDGEARQGGNIYTSTNAVVIEKTGVVTGGVAAKAHSADTGYNGGNVYLAGKTLTVRGEISDGTAYSGGNIAAVGATTVTVDGGKLTGGNAAAWSGGNYYGNNGIVKLVNGAVMADGVAVGMGGNAYLGSGGELHLTDSTVSGGKTTSTSSSAYGGGSIYLGGRTVSGTEANSYPDKYDYAVLNAVNSTIEGGVAEQKNGGNIYATGAKVDLQKTTVTGGSALSSGGNIYLTSAKTTAVFDKETVVSGGKTTTATKSSNYVGGGNIFISGDANVTIAGRVEDGYASCYGGNFLISGANLILAEGAAVSNGEAGCTGTAAGGNICKWNGGNLDIQAGAAVNGGMAGDGVASSIYANNSKKDAAVSTLTVAGDVLGGCLRVNDAYVNTTVTGTAKISRLQIMANVKINVVDMAEGADVKVQPAAEGVFSNTIADGKAEEYAKYFSDYNGLRAVSAKDDALLLGTIQYCAHCDQEVLWSTFDPKTANYSGTHHLIVKADATMPAQFVVGSSSQADNDVVIDLNGHTIDTGAGRLALVYGKLSIYDTSAEGTGKIIRTKTNSGLNGGLIQLSKGTLNIYGGEFTAAEGTTIGARGGLIMSYATVNIYGGKFHGGCPVAKTGSDGAVSNARGGLINTTGPLNIYGGEFYGGKTVAEIEGSEGLGGLICSEGGAVYIKDAILRDGVADKGGIIYTTGKLTIEGATTISGGQAVDGGNIYTAGETRINGGVITEGVAAGNGGNIYLKDASDKDMVIGADAKVTKGQAVIGGNMYLEYYTTVEGEVSDGIATEYAGNIYHKGTLNIGKADGSVAAKITGGEAPYAGSIYSVWKLNLYAGSEISGGKATAGNGGNLYTVVSTSAFTNIYGTVTGGSAAKSADDADDGFGGNIYCEGAGPLNIGKEDGSAAALVTKGTAAHSGNIYAKKGTVNVFKGATVSDGVSSGNAGNIGLSESVILNVYGTVTGGQAAKNAGNITGAGSSKITVDGGLVTNGTATGSGGNIQSNNGYIYLKNGAVVSGGTAGTNGGNIYQGGTVDGRGVWITDSTVTDGKANGTDDYTGGGNIYAIRDVTVTNSTVSNGTAGKCGGNLLISKASLTLGEGAVVEGGVGPQLGANICKFNNGDVNILAGAKVSGGNIYMNNATANTSSNLTVAGTVECQLTVNNSSKGEMSATVTGDAKLSHLRLVSIMLNVVDMTENADVKVDAEPGVFTNTIANGKAEAYAEYFSDFNGEMPVAAYKDTLVLGYIKPCEHCGGEDALFLPFTAADAVTTGHWLVLEDTSMSSQLQIGSSSKHDVDTVIDLNGKTVTIENCTGEGASTGRFALVYGKLSIQDSTEAKEGKIITKYEGSGGLTGGLILTSTGTELNLYAGTLDVEDGLQAEKGGVIAHGAGTFNMYGGTILGSNATAEGGALRVSGTAVANIYGGTITGGQSAKGGNIFIGESAKVNLYGGEITDGQAANGGNIHAVGKLVVHNADVVISGGVATENGGNIYDENITTITAGTVSGGKAAGNGGNIYHSAEKGADRKSTLSIGVNAKVLDGQATNGGNIYGGYSVAVAGTVSGGKATENGGNIYHVATLEVGRTDGSAAAVITGGHADNIGGNIYTAWKLHVYKGATVSDGTGRNGGNIGVAGSNEINIYGTVSGGVAELAGGNITGAGGSKINIKGGTVTDGVATTTSGGNIQSNNGYITLTDGATVTGGTAKTFGGNIGTNQSTAGRKVEITDATVTGGTAANFGGNIYVAGTTTVQGILNITNSTVSDGTTTAAKTTHEYIGGGNIYVSAADLNVVGSTISGGKCASKFGGSILATNGDVILGKDTVVDGGDCTNFGDVICKWNAGNLEIQAGVVVKSADKNSSGIYMNNSGGAKAADLKIAGDVQVPVKTDSSAKGLNIIVSGAAKVANLNVYKTLLVTVQEMTEGAKVVVTAQPGVFTTPIADGKAAEYAKYFVGSDGTAAGVVGDCLSLGYVRACAHCGGENAVFQPYTYNKDAQSGHWILLEDVELDVDQINLAEGDDVVLDLNGNTLSRAGKLFLLYEATLSIQDTSEKQEGKVITTKGSARVGGVLQTASDKAVVNLYSGEMTAADGVVVRNGGIVQLGAGATFNMYGGKITNGNVVSMLNSENELVQGNGGNVTINANATFNMYGGTIANGACGAPVKDSAGSTVTESRAVGGNVYVAGTLNMYKGAVIDGGTTDQASGGNIFNVGKLNIHEGATVSNGLAQSYSGGNIYSEGTLNLGAEGEKEPAIITGGKGTQGGNIRAAGTINIYENGQISYGQATSTTGGNLDISTATVNMYGGTIYGGVAKTNGGNVCITRSVTATKGAFNMYDGIIMNGTATKNGGNVAMVFGVFNMEGGLVTGGVSNGASEGGGNFYLTYRNSGTTYKASTLNITGEDAVISNGVTAFCGGNIYATGNADAVGSGSVITMTNGVIKGGNSTRNDQDNVRLSAGAVFNFLGGTVYGTDAADLTNPDSIVDAGSAITANNSTVRLGGNATVVCNDGGQLGLIRLVTGSRNIQVLNDWTGTASFVVGAVDINKPYTFGAVAKCGSLSDGTFTAGGTYTGKLYYAKSAANIWAVTGADGTMAIN